MKRLVLLLCVLATASCSASEVRCEQARAFKAEYRPPHTDFLPMPINGGVWIMPMDAPEEYIVWFDVGLEDGVPAYGTWVYTSIPVGSTRDITYTTGFSPHVTQINN